MSTALFPRKKSRRGEPPWDIATLFPNQGHWSEEDYFLLPTNQLIELSDGHVEVLPMPTELHQTIALLLYELLSAFVRSRDLGKVLAAPFSVRLRPDKVRQPDVVFMLAKHSHRRGNRCWEGADLAMEVVSDDPEDRKRDLVKKRREYAQARIPEYWIIDPKEGKITVLKLKDKKYVLAGVYSPGDKAKSVLLAGFEVDVESALKPD